MNYCTYYLFLSSLLEVPNISGGKRDSPIQNVSDDGIDDHRLMFEYIG